MKTAAIATLGCKVNQVETSSIVQQLKQHGYQIVDFFQTADIYIINTCTVTNRTDFKSRNLIRQAQKVKSNNPEVKIIVTGCYAQKEKEEINAIGEIDLIVDNQSKIDLDLWLDNKDYSFLDIMNADKMLWNPIDTMHERTRAFIKIQDGCDYYCSYCAVPYGRGHSRSLDFDEVIKQAAVLVEKGYQELVITGVNIGLYNDKIRNKHLSDIIKVIVEIDNLKLLRISSIEPDLWNEELFDVITQSDKICPHFHIPLQSGSDSVLQRMSRRYSAQIIKEICERLHIAKPNCAIGLDIICGFPGESEEEFLQTTDLLTALPITYLHVFSFSKRKGTPAAAMQNQVNGKMIKQRTTILTEISSSKKQEYIRMLLEVKTELRGIVEKIDNNIGTSLSDHYIRIYQSNKLLKENTLICGKGFKKYKEGILI